MNQYSNLPITRSATATADSITEPWVRLEQITPAQTRKFASIADVYRAWTLAVAGMSPSKRRTQGCPVEFFENVVRFFLGFYAWPSDPSLPYTLTATMGEISPPPGGQAAPRVLRLCRQLRGHRPPLLYGPGHR